MASYLHFPALEDDLSIGAAHFHASQRQCEGVLYSPNLDVNGESHTYFYRGKVDSSETGLKVGQFQWQCIELNGVLGGTIKQRQQFGVRFC